MNDGAGVPPPNTFPGDVLPNGALLPNVALPPKAGGAPNPLLGLLLNPPKVPNPLVGDPNDGVPPKTGLEPNVGEPPKADAVPDCCCGEPKTPCCGLPNACPLGEGVLKLPPVVPPNIDDACVVAC